MKIVFQANQELPIIGYGGTERIIFWLMCHLKELGHQPVLIGNPKSKVEDYGIELIPYDPKSTSNWESLVPKDTDIIHLGYNYEFQEIDTPALFTVHGNGQIGEKFPLNSVFVSKKHALNHQSNSFIYNGINFDEYPLTTMKKISWNNFLFLAKASWRIKNLKSCLKAVKKAKKSLNIVGGKSWLPSRYVTNYGFQGGAKKNEIIQQSDALLFPVKWEEPFGLAIIEAMGFGLPVIGTTFGSLPELIPDFAGVTCHSENEFLDIVAHKPKDFDSTKIISYARDTFNSRIMAENYLVIYEKVLNGETLNSSPPSWKHTNSPTAPVNF